MCGSIMTIPTLFYQFHKEVKSLLSVLEDVGNPFDDDSNDLFDIETKIVVPETIAQNLYKLENVGEKHFRDFIEQRVWKRSVPLSDTISKIKLSLFKAVGSYLLQVKMNS